MQIESTQLQVSDGQHFLKRAAWHAFKLFAALRIGTFAWVLVLSYMGGRTITEPNVLCGSSFLQNSLYPGSLLSSWLRWDTICYLMIAESGYTVHTGLTVWPPLYPLLIRLFSSLFMPPMLAALVISSITTWLAFVLLYVLITDSHNETTARNTLFLYAMYPLAFFLVAGYTESMFLALVAGCLLLARRGYWGWAGVLAALATLTRNQGIVLCLVLVWEGILQYRGRQDGKTGDLLKILFASALPALTFGAFAFYVYYWLDAGWPWQTLGTLWGQYSGFPWEGIIGNIKQLMTLPMSKDLYWLPTTILDLFMAILIPLTLILYRHSTRSTYLVFAWLIVLMGLIKLGPNDTLISFSRYVITVFPFFVALSPIVMNRYSRLAVLGVGLGLQAVFLSMFYIWSWAG